MTGTHAMPRGKHITLVVKDVLFKDAVIFAHTCFESVDILDTQDLDRDKFFEMLVGVSR